jgi:fatty acyl-CoA reductase
VNVNIDPKGTFEEKIYNEDQDVERMVSKLMKMNPKEIEDNLDKILNGYPNTYTFTKALLERSLNKKRGNLPCCIVRPAMTGASVKEPFVGWTDTISALGAPLTFAGLGINRYNIGTGGEICDLIAVDQCVNSILICTAHCAHNPEKLHIYNHGSSGTLNPLTQRVVVEALNEFT